MPVVGAREAKIPARSIDADLVQQLVKRHELARALGHRYLFAVAHEAHPGDEQNVDRVAVEAQRLRGVLEPRDGAVVVGAPDVDQLVEAAAELLHDVADVAREIRRLAVRADNDAVLVVAELGRLNHSAPSCSYM